MYRLFLHVQDRVESGQTSSADSPLELFPADRDALDEMLPLVYDELRRMAHQELRRERPDHTLSTTDLVHEAYATLIDGARGGRDERVRFFALAATAMRRVLIEYARRRRTLKRGGGWRAISLDDATVATVAADESAVSLIALDEALTRLGAIDARLSRVVEYRYFGGLSEDETAEVLGVTSRTVRRDWVKAKGWLYRELHESAP
jgi:RNA polymerase sigma factor (TIGR02999 family)